MAGAGFQRVPMSLAYGERRHGSRTTVGWWGDYPEGSGLTGLPVGWEGEFEGEA